MLSTTIKKLVLDTTSAASPVNILYGVVLQQQPLQIQVDQRFTLSEAFLIVPESLTRQELNLTTGEVTIGYRAAASTAHSHQAVGTITAVIREGLQTGDQVVLVRVQGGQSYLVLDKVVHL